MNSCPHCGGVSGFEYEMTLKTLRTSRWDGSNDEEVEVRKAGVRRNIKCADCGKTVRPSRWKHLNYEIATPEETAAIDEAVRAGRITFAPGWNK